MSAPTPESTAEAALPEPAVESKLMPPAAAATLAPVEPPPPAPTCPDCKRPLVVYSGDNPAKVGTGFCTNPKCGGRKPLAR